MNYLKNLDKTEIIKDILKIVSKLSECNGSSIFLINDDQTGFTCLEHFCIFESDIKVKFVPTISTDEIFISNDDENTGGFICPCKINNILIIPLFSGGKKIGIIALLNRNSDFDKKVVDLVNPFINVCQIILEKYEIMDSFKKLEELYLTGYSKDLFLANVSHEIRTPLNGIVGYLQLLTQTKLNSIQKNYVNSITNCSLQLLKIINDILDFSKLSCGMMNINNDCFKLTEIVDSCNDALKQQIIEKKQKILFKYGDSLPEYIISDKQKIIQILINLISNANKFTDFEGDIDVYINKIDYNILEFSVKDNGIGISEEDQNRLFNTFIQINNVKYRTGTGLGLYICKKISELLDGNIKVHSKIGEGSTFVFEIKFKKYEEYENQINKDVKLLKNKYILVVDDNTDNRILLSEILFEWEMIPVVCASALEALRMVMSKRYDFALGLIDIHMPGTSGIELAKQIKEENSFFEMIALSSIDTFINSLDFETKLDKPINKLQLFNAIYSIINKKKNPIGYIGGNIPDIIKGEDIFSKNILIAEDIEYNSEMLIQILKSLKFKNVTIAKNGYETIKLLDDKNKYDILLLDLIMPVMNGYDVINFVNKENIDIKIIVLTASVLQEDVNRCKELGIKYFLSKPINIHHLKNLIYH
jgi:two-component system sensor histidine kinase/response regulator